MAEAFVARVSRWRTGLLVVGAIGFVAAGLWMLAIGDVRGPLLHFWAWAAILFSGACAVAGARQLSRTGAVLEIDGRGLLWQRWSPEWIP